VVIVIAGALFLSASFYVSKRHDDDVMAAQADAAVVAAQLPGLVSQLDLAAVFDATSAAYVDGRPETDFPGRPDVPDAQLWAVSSTPTQLKLTYRVSSHGQDICVTTPRDSPTGVGIRSGSCSQI
jgi:hypothetical protein